ncbi:MAG: glycosyltransferase [bacterium]
MKTAIAHHWLLSMRGGEKVLEAIVELFPEADIFTLFYEPEAVSPFLRSRNIFPSFLNRIPASSRIYPDLLPLYPFAVRAMDLSSYDLVISSDASLVKGVRKRPGAMHICYCHSPPRYLWDMGEVYLENAGLVKRAMAGMLTPWLKRWDYRAAQEVDGFIVNSDFVKERISAYYHRDSVVICPPVESFEVESSESGDYYLWLGQLVPYKRADLAVEAFTKAGKRLVIIGDGPERKNLEKKAGLQIEFLGWVPEERKKEYLSACRAVVFPGTEDFGIVPLEAQMAGKPVIAYAKGGALETVIEETTGVFFNCQEPGSLIDAITRFEKKEAEFSTEAIRANALRFKKENFQEALKDYIQTIIPT